MLSVRNRLVAIVYRRGCIGLDELKREVAAVVRFYVSPSRVESEARELARLGVVRLEDGRVCMGDPGYDGRGWLKALLFRELVRRGCLAWSDVAELARRAGTKPLSAATVLTRLVREGVAERRGGVVCYRAPPRLSPEAARLYRIILEEGCLTAQQAAWRLGLRGVRARRFLRELASWGLIGRVLGELWCRTELEVPVGELAGASGEAGAGEAGGARA